MRRSCPGSPASSSPKPALAVLPAIIVASLLLGGCASALPDRVSEAGPPGPSTTQSATPSPSAAEVPSPSPTGPPRLPALEDLVITPEGLGSLLIGEPVESTDMVYLNRDACLTLGVNAPGHPDNARWVANYGSADDRPFGAFVDQDGVVRLIGVQSSDVSTASGIRIGSTLEELRAAHPELIDLTPSRLSTLHAIETEEGLISFEVVIPGEYWPEFNGRVFDIRIMAQGDEPQTVVASDNTVGGCL